MSHHIEYHIQEYMFNNKTIKAAADRAMRHVRNRRDGHLIGIMRDEDYSKALVVALGMRATFHNGTMRVFDTLSAQREHLVYLLNKAVDDIDW